VRWTREGRVGLGPLLLASTAQGLVSLSRYLAGRVRTCQRREFTRPSAAGTAREPSFSQRLSREPLLMVERQVAAAPPARPRPADAPDPEPCPQTTTAHRLHFPLTSSDETRTRCRQPRGERWHRRRLGRHSPRQACGSSASSCSTLGDSGSWRRSSLSASSPSASSSSASCLVRLRPPARRHSQG
jgi:hypothetical protein